MMRHLGKVILVAGMVVAIGNLATDAQGQGKGGGRGGRGGPGQLLNNPSVQKELKLTEEQVTKAREAVQSVREKHQDELAGLQDATPEKRTEILKSVADDTTKALASILTPEQEKRLKQITLQTQGAGAFGTSDVATALKLTDDQKDKIKTINDDVRKESGALFQGGGDVQENMKKMAALRKEAMEKVVAVLTPEQKSEWKNLTGEPFELVMAPGGGGGKGKRKKDKDKE